MNERVVVQGSWVFAAGVTAGIDGALRLAAELRGKEAAQTIQLYMAYAPEPPFNSGTPETASPQILERARQSAASITAKREETARRIAAKLGIATATQSTGRDRTREARWRQIGCVPSSTPASLNNAVHV